MAVVENKDAIIQEHAAHEGDTGSPEVQVAILTTRIQHLTEHMRVHQARSLEAGRPAAQALEVPTKKGCRALPITHPKAGLAPVGAQL